MKVLTKEAKIHLATKVDDWEPVGVEDVFVVKKNLEAIALSNYNPNNPNSDYAMKYLRGILDNLSSINTELLFEHVSPNWIIDCIDEILEDILTLTEFKGEVWE